MKTWWIGLAVCALVATPSAAMAGNDAHAPAKQASMVLTGSIVVNPDGTVASYKLDHVDEILPGARTELQRVVPQWTFQPVMRDGKAVNYTSPMSVRLVAKPATNGKYTVTVASAYFGGGNAVLSYAKGVHRARPAYPRRESRNGVTGTVYVLAEIGRDGTVQHVAVRKVNLSTRGTSDLMRVWRKDLGDAAIDAARRWKFDVPTQGPSAQRDHWFASIPVSFVKGSRHWRGRRYGHWHSYLPGPKQYIAWAEQQTLADADAVPAGGGIYSTHQTLQLLSSLGGH